ncbi:HAD family hydrolase [Paenibacillus turpanensis]|uniref:HAD family hydrolase n=1 Tax=Paenibacillus turpanensis TaxID=2689078 RepID=UPI00140CA576|nr:HAD hydrolase-like protein [Paenibacillus turpanensis]
MNQTLLFDLDDTLIHCNKYFDMVIEQFAEQMKVYFGSYGISTQTFVEKQAEIDTAGIAIHGFKADRFPKSFVETYDYFSSYTGRTASEEEKQTLYDIGESVYKVDFEPYPNMVETLEKLQAEGHTLCVYTGGDEVIQRTKLKVVGLESYFGSRVFVAQHKGLPFLESLLQREQFNRATTWMIGNSLRSDIRPALHAGINAIFLPALNPWHYDNVELDSDPKGAYLTLNELLEVPEAIRSYVNEGRAECKFPQG